MSSGCFYLKSVGHGASRYRRKSTSIRDDGDPRWEDCWSWKWRGGVLAGAKRGFRCFASRGSSLSVLQTRHATRCCSVVKAAFDEVKSWQQLLKKEEEKERKERGGIREVFY